ncbi:MAG: hypothetical protein WCO11_12195 [Sphingomonadales bacterium]|jgi:hypothetical protein
MIAVIFAIAASLQPVLLPQREIDSLVAQSVSCRRGKTLPNGLTRISLSLTFYKHSRVFSQMPLRCPGMKVEIEEAQLNNLLRVGEATFKEKGILLHLNMDVVGQVHWSTEHQTSAIRVSKIIKAGPWYFETIDVGVGNR